MDSKTLSIPLNPPLKGGLLTVIPPFSRGAREARILFKQPLRYLLSLLTSVGFRLGNVRQPGNSDRQVRGS